MKKFIDSYLTSDVIIFILFFVGFKLLTLHNPFFWDTIQLCSRQAHFYFENNFGSFLLPDDIDSGHPPFMGMTLALLWKVFDRELWVGHCFILVVLTGIVFQLKHTVRFFLPENTFVCLALLLFDATFLAQSSLVSPDVVVILFFLCSLNGVLYHKRGLLLLGSIGLCCVSTRGEMAFLGLGLFYFITSYKSQNWKLVLCFCPAIALAIGFQGYHFIEKGWILYHPNSPWIGSFEKVSILGFLRNLLLLGWRLVDTGRLLNFAILAILLFIKRKTLFQNRLFILITAIFITTVIPLLLYNNLLGHRYLLIFIWLSDILLLQLLITITNKKYSYTLIFGMLITQLSGNFWVYPDKISKGWDATLAYLPVNKLKGEAEEYFITHQIPKSKVATGFPMYSSSYYTYLSGDTISYRTITTLKNQHWVLYSNVVNDFSDEQIDSLKNYFTPVFENKSVQVKMIVYENKFTF